MFVVLFDALILPFQLAFKTLGWLQAFKKLSAPLRNNNQDSFDEFWFWWTTILFGRELSASLRSQNLMRDLKMA